MRFANPIPLTHAELAVQANSPVQKEFMEFCAETDMDVISVECAPEVCTLIKGKPRTRGLPAGSRVKPTSSFGTYPPQRASSKRHHLRQNF